MEKELAYLRRYYKGNVDEAISRLKKGEPVQYIVGNVNFYGYELMVNKDVLIPRRETEELTEEVIRRMKVFSNPVIADVATGSGAIAITLSKELNVSLYASDISEKALLVAEKNAFDNQASVTFFQGDMLKPFIDNNVKLDVIVSNPPYIKENEEIEPVVFNNEPHLALFAKDGGLEFYQKIFMDAKKVLNDRFLIALEIGESQGKSVADLAKSYLGDVTVEIKKDLSQKNRMVFVYNY